ncbi:MAG: ABC transporter substrate-binding protein [Rhodospirillales bacterium]|nr:ABC transporter substrate-binding protein [Alphaproteobacteria bacterium]MBL6948486.1 ABC transporter substrate-binding protein [Rhodospirillales bacterium]
MVQRRVFLRRSLASVFAVALVTAFLASHTLPGRAQADAFADGAKTFIEALTADAITMLTGKDISREERAKRFRVLMNKNFSIKGIAKFVLGRQLRKASEDQKKKYLKLYEDLMVATYADRFAKYSGERLLVKRSEVRGKKDAIVYTTMVKAKNAADPLKVDWRVRAKGDTFTIVDVMVEGISMIMTQKSEFSSFMKTSGGNFDTFLEELKKRVDSNSPQTEQTASSK